MANQRSFVMIKPDGIKKNIAGECLRRFEKAGLKISAAKLILMSRWQAARLYREHRRKKFYSGLVRFAVSGPALVTVVQGGNAVSKIRKTIGPTDPKKAPRGTIRGDFGTVLPFNIVHASDSPKSAKREIPIFFRKSELLRR